MLAASCSAAGEAEPTPPETQPKPLTSTSSAAATTTSSTTTTAGPVSITTESPVTVPDDHPILILGDPLSLNRSLLRADAELTLMNHYDEPVTFEANEGTLGRWELAPGETLVIDVSGLPTTQIRIHAAVEAVRLLATLDRSGAEQPDAVAGATLVVDLSEVEVVPADGMVALAIYGFDGDEVWWSLDVPAFLVQPAGWSAVGRGSTERDAANANDWARLHYYTATKESVLDGAVFVGMIEGKLGDWSLFRVNGGADHRRYSSSYATVAYEGVWVVVTLTSATDEHAHLVEAVLTPAVDEFGFDY